MSQDSKDIYKKLARHLDRLPGGFPATGSGVELRILRRLFNPQEAQMAVHLSLIPEEPPVVARRAGMAVAETAQLLDAMSRKGLIYRIGRTDQTPRYMAQQYVVGIWEYHVNDLDPELIRDMEIYVPHLMQQAWKKPQLRTIPVNRSISSELAVMTYENAEELVATAKKAVVAPCICRREQGLIGKGCDRPEETCLVFNKAADFYLDNGLGRQIDRGEVLQILKTAEESGLVLQPNNARRVVNICCCCGDCCAVLRNLKTQPFPARLIASPFYAANHGEACTGCGACLQRCQMDAIQLDDDQAQVDRDRCIGCGLCVSTCPAQSLKLVRKPPAEQPPIPANAVEAAIELGRARGRLSTADQVMMRVKSKFDRLMTASANRKKSPKDTI